MLHILVSLLQDLKALFTYSLVYHSCVNNNPIFGITPALFFLVSTERRGRAHRGQQLPPAGLQDHGVGGRHPGSVLRLQQDPAQGEGLRPRGVRPLLMLTISVLHSANLG